MLSTTLELLQKNETCLDICSLLARRLGADWSPTRPIPLEIILNKDGLDVALWTLQAVPAEQHAKRDTLARMFACWCLRHTPLPDGDTTWRHVAEAQGQGIVSVAECVACGLASQDDLTVAANKALAAVRQIGTLGYEAARVTGWGTIRIATRDALWWVTHPEAWQAALCTARATRIVAWELGAYAAFNVAYDAQTRRFSEMLTRRSPQEGAETP